MKSFVRITLILAIAVVALLIGTAVGGFPWTPPHAAGVTDAPQPGAVHTEWSYYPVGGFLLTDPAADSLGHHRYIVLPEGSVLAVPHEVTGVDLDSIPDMRKS